MSKPFASVVIGCPSSSAASNTYCGNRQRQMLQPPESVSLRTGGGSWWAPEGSANHDQHYPVAAYHPYTGSAAPTTNRSPVPDFHSTLSLLRCVRPGPASGLLCETLVSQQLRHQLWHWLQIFLNLRAKESPCSCTFGVWRSHSWCPSSMRTHSVRCISSWHLMPYHMQCASRASRWAAASQSL